MKEVYIDAIRERDWVESVFLVREKITATAKNGKPYLTLKLMDRTGEIEGRVWDNVDALGGCFEKDDFIHASGKASVYLGKMQLVIQNLTQIDDDMVDVDDFLPVAPRQAEEMLAELRELIASMKNIHLQSLMNAFVADAEFMQAYSKAPAAKTMHHVYLGGLLDHSLSVARLADMISRNYPEVDRDLLLVGALLHDVGKVAELRYSRSFEYTDAGKLLGHIIMGVELVEEKVRQLHDFPPLLATLVKHLLLSHHGQYEFGSPKRPKTIEAVILNFIDDLDSKVNGVTSYMDKEKIEGGEWTSYHRLYDRYFYRSAGAQPEASRAADKPEASGKPKIAPKPLSTNKQGGALSHTLGEQLKGKSLDLFSSATDNEEK